MTGARFDVVVVAYANRDTIEECITRVRALRGVGELVVIDHGTDGTADGSGHWTATLPAMPAGGPYTLIASGGGKSETASDVLVGDVFLCTGQSNMALSQRAVNNAAQDARTATDSQIRQLSIATTGSTSPLSTFATKVGWTVESPETVPNFSASCWYFVRDLKKTVNVPMGMVVAAWGGARVRACGAWMRARRRGNGDGREGSWWSCPLFNLLIN